jgi:hypothetical protein
MEIYQRKSVQSSLQRNVIELKAEISDALRGLIPDMTLYFYMTWKLEQLLHAHLEYSEFCYLIFCRLTLIYKLQNIRFLKDVDYTFCPE